MKNIRERKKKGLFLWLCLSVIMSIFVVAVAQEKRKSRSEKFLKSVSQSNFESCKKLTKHQESKPKPGEVEIAIYPSPSMLWNLKNEELYAQCKVETTEETIKRLQEQLEKDKKRWIEAKENAEKVAIVNL